MNIWKMIEISTAKSLDAEYSQLELKRVGIGGNQYTLCSQDNVEDEYHFLLHCLKYSSLRTDFFNNIGYVSSPLM